MTKNEELANNNDMLKYLNENNPRKGKSDLKNLLKSQLKKYGKDEILVLISVCNQCEKYEDVITCFEELYLQYNEVYLQIDQLELLEIGFKSLIRNKQKQINKLKSIFDYSLKNNEDSEETKGLITGINEIHTSDFKAQNGVYDLSGRKLSPHRGGDGEGLSKGLYIIDGKKVLVR